jgi:hypothetical protein
MGWECSNHGEKRTAYRILVESQKEINNWKHLDVRGRIILRQILENRMGWYGVD